MYVFARIVDVSCVFVCLCVFVLLNTTSAFQLTFRCKSCLMCGVQGLRCGVVYVVVLLLPANSY